MPTITFNNNKIELNKLTLQQLIKHNQYMRDEVVSEVKRQMVGLPLELCKQIWDSTRQETKQIEVGSDAYNVSCKTFPNLAHALYLSASTTSKDFTVENAIEVLSGDPLIAPMVLYQLLEFNEAQA